LNDSQSALGSELTTQHSVGRHRASHATGNVEKESRLIITYRMHSLQNGGDQHSNETVCHDAPQTRCSSWECSSADSTFTTDDAHLYV